MATLYDFPWRYDTYQEAIKQRFINNTHVEPLSPRPINTGYQPYVDPWGRVITGQTASDLVYGWHLPGVKKDTDLSGISPAATVAQWSAVLSPAATPSSATNSFWPDPGLLSPAWSDCLFAAEVNGIYQFRLANSGSSASGTGLIAEFYNAGTGVYPTENTNLDPRMIIDQDADKIIVQIYIDGPSGTTLPANSLKFRFRDGTGAAVALTPDATLDRSILLPAIPCQVWTEVAVTPPATNNASAYTDKNSNVRAGVTYDRCTFEVNSAIPAAFFTTNLLNIYFTGGRQSSTYTTPPAPAPDDLVETCTAEGSQVVSDAPSVNYGVILAIDHDRQDVCYTGGGWPITSAFQLAGSCAADGQTANNIYAGDRYGRLSRFFLEGVYAVGAPTENFRKDVLSGGASSVVVDTTVFNLPVRRMALKNVIATLEKSSGLRQSRLITINDASQIMVNSAWDVNPAPGDTLWLGLMDCRVDFPELHFLRGGAVVAIEPDFIPQSDTHEPSFQISVWQPTAQRTWAEATSVFATFSRTELSFEEGQILMDPVMAKAIRIILSWKAVPYGVTRMNNLKAYLRPYPGETGRV